MQKAIIKFIKKIFQEALGELSIDEIISNPDLMRCAERIYYLLCV